MRSILRIFGRSPFVPLQIHMEKVAKCVEKVPEILAAYRRKDSAAVEELSQDISKLEHEADLIKHDIRDNLPRGIFLPVSRADLLKILNIQDSIANRAENIGVILTFKQSKSFEALDLAFDEFVEKCLETFWLARGVIDQFDELLEAGFGGSEAHAARELVDKVARREYESDVAQRKLARVMFAAEDSISYTDFFLFGRLVRQISEIADRSNNLASAIRSTLEN
jgi:uncharacterized protein